MDLLQVLQQYSMLFIISAFFLGLVVGSFLNVVILRLPPIMEYIWKKDYAEFTETKFEEPAPPSIALDRSHCPKCKNKLHWYHNIPLISYILLLGKCSFCTEPISMRYPSIELLSGLLTAWMAYLFGVELQFVAAVLLVWFLITITWIDIDTYLIPDQLSLTLLWLGLFFSLFDFSITPSASIIGAIVGYLSLWSVFHLFKMITGKEGMGYGDFKLLAAGGAWLGYEQLIAVLMISSVSGLIIAVVQKLMGKTESKIPFGPYLSIGILTAYLIGDLLMERYFVVA